MGLEQVVCLKKPEGVKFPETVPLKLKNFYQQRTRIECKKIILRRKIFLIFLLVQYGI